jgi:nitroimidazol reductase NimA-like FMN-containing flavoprotein (pyridoxamine 5'-phosphate oxidase superfamily)
LGKSAETTYTGEVDATMRRKEQEITDKSVIESIMERGKVCRIGLCDSGNPYVVPVAFGYRDHCLYFHSAREGRKIDVLKQNNRVCVEVDIDVQFMPSEPPCSWRVKYLSVIGFGRASFVETAQEKREALDVIMGHYSGQSCQYADEAVAKVAIIKVEFDAITGKRSGY